MDGILDLLFVALFVLGILSRSKKKKKASENKSAPSPARVLERTAEPADPKPVNRKNAENIINAFAEIGERMASAQSPAPEAVSARKKPEKTAIEAESAMKDRAEIIKARIQESLSGVSATDEHGCIGGSMPDHNAEGETLTEHAEHEENRRRKLAEEAAVSAESFRKPTAADLRRAVVMSEILDKPVSLRGRRT